MARNQVTGRAPVVLGVLFAGAFVMGCAEMLVVGLIDLIAADLNVSVPAAGALVTANALGLAVGGPLLTLVSARFDRRPVLLVATAVFVAANLLPVLGAGYESFLGARVVIGAVQGLFIAAGITTATSVVPPERAGRAMAVVITGFASASALGLPLGTLLGQAVGWRGSFTAVVGIAVAVLVAAAVVLPPVRPTAGSGSLGRARAAFAPPVLAVLALCFVLFAAIQAALTYLVPFLDEVTGVTGPAVGGYLLAYGVATTVGSSLGGRFADTGAARALVVGAVGVTASLLLLGVLGSNPVAAAVAVAGTGLFVMGCAPSLQHRVVGLAGSGAALAASLPASAVNAGIAAGSVVGGVALDLGGVRAVATAGAALAAVAVAVAAATRRLAPPASPAPAHDPADRAPAAATRS